jgi:type VI secretion system secreted protein VgrG
MPETAAAAAKFTADIAASTKFTFRVDGLSAETQVARFEAVEAMSSLFEVELTLTSDDNNIAFADVVGKTALLTLETHKSEPRYLHGIVSRFRHFEDGKKLTVYQATLVPKLWRLRHRHDSRIFQDKSVKAILQQVLEDAGITDVRLALNGTYNPREYCVQYRESDFAFISRLMEEEGISYFFEHTEAKHVLVLGDAPSAAAPIPGADTLSYKGTLGAMAHGESVSRFSSSEEVRPGKVTLTDYNFEKPSLALLESSAAKLDDDLEVYDYPGEYTAPGEGTAYTKVRLEEWQARRATAEGESGCVRLVPGYLFSLSDHTREAANQQYLLTAVRHRGAQPQMTEAGAGGEGPSYHNAFQAIPSKVPFRPDRVTPRPTVKGAQTAIVTGAKGEEIYPDKYGRVKVHFHWDRKGKKDETSSCWIRVSQLWAGASWGAMWIPRVGHEVIVDFLEGDPDRPIITGRVYHGTNLPPYALPTEKTKSTIKSDSSLGGGGSNELRFEDKKGSEEIFLHGEKDWTIEIEHDKVQTIGHDESLEVGHNRKKRVEKDQSESIGGSKTIEVAQTHTESIGTSMAINVGTSFTLNVGTDLTEAVGAKLSRSVGASLEETIQGGVTRKIAQDVNDKIGGASIEAVAKAKKTTVEEDYTLTISKDMALTVSKSLRQDIKEEKALVVGNKITVECGDAKITVEKSGNITVEGKNISVKATGNVKVEAKKVDVKSDGAVNLEGSGKVVLKGSGISVN